MEGRILVIGSSNLDMILQVPSIPRPGETIGQGTFSQANGGKGANQAVAAARAGATVTFVSCVGQDSFGTVMKKDFLSEGIDVQYVRQTESAPTGVAFIFVDQDGENSIGVGPGANFELSKEDIDRASPAFEEADIVLVQLEVPFEVIRYSIETAHNQQVPVILNPAPAAEIPDDLLAKIFGLVLNETETEVITGINPNNEKSLEMASQQILDKGVQNVIITLGKDGSYVKSSEVTEWIKAPEVKAVDTTAAGDVYCGNLAAALSRDQSLLQSVEFATAAAALAVTKLGAQPSAPTRQESETFIRERS